MNIIVKKGCVLMEEKMTKREDGLLVLGFVLGGAYVAMLVFVEFGGML